VSGQIENRDIDSWDKAEAFALSLPGTVRSTIYNMPMVMIAKNRRGFLVTGHEAKTSFAVPLDEGYAEMLMETDPDSFWQTPHYEGWPALLVRYDSADPERVHAMIERSRDWTAARPRPKPRKAKA